MNTPALESLLTRFRRQLTTARVLRRGMVILFVAALAGTALLAQPAGEQVMFLVAMTALIVWVWIVVTAVRLSREVHTSNILIATGQLDRAEQWLRAILERFSLSLQGKIMAAQQLATVLLQKQSHEEVIAICRAVLGQPLSGLKHVAVGTRLMLADSLLMLDRIPEAYEAMRPVYDLPLSLAERMKLLPIQLRYELAADHAGFAVQGLREKVQIAELLDSSRAALVHALLAEACRRQRMSAQQEFLLKRAWLYGDLEPLASQYRAISPLLAAQGGVRPKPDTA